MPEPVVEIAHIEVNQIDGTKATLQFNAATLDTFIAGLLAARERLTPAVPDRWALGQKCMALVDPHFGIELDMQTGGSLVHLRHPGLGWLHFVFPSGEAGMLVRIMSEHIAAARHGAQAGSAN